MRDLVSQKSPSTCLKRIRDAVCLIGHGFVTFRYDSCKIYNTLQTKIGAPTLNGALKIRIDNRMKAARAMSVYSVEAYIEEESWH